MSDREIYQTCIFLIDYWSPHASKKRFKAEFFIANFAFKLCFQQSFLSGKSVFYCCLFSLLCAYYNMMIFERDIFVSCLGNSLVLMISMNTSLEPPLMVKMNRQAARS